MAPNRWSGAQSYIMCRAGGTVRHTGKSEPRGRPTIGLLAMASCAKRQRWVCERSQRPAGARPRRLRYWASPRAVVSACFMRFAPSSRTILFIPQLRPATNNHPRESANTSPAHGLTSRLPTATPRGAQARADQQGRRSPKLTRIRDSRPAHEVIDTGPLRPGARIRPARAVHGVIRAGQVRWRRERHRHGRRPLQGWARQECHHVRSATMTCRTRGA